MILLLEDSVYRLKDVENRRVNPAAKSAANVGRGQVETLLSYYQALQQAVSGDRGETATAADVMQNPDEVDTTTNTDDELDQVTESGMRYRVVE